MRERAEKRAWNPGARLLGGDDRDVLRERRVQRLGGALRRRAAADLDRRDVRERVDARVGAAGDGETVDRVVQLRERGAELALDGALARLARPAAEAGAVVRERQLHEHVRRRLTFICKVLLML